MYLLSIFHSLRENALASLERVIFHVRQNSSVPSWRWPAKLEEDSRDRLGIIIMVGQLKFTCFHRIHACLIPPLFNGPVVPSFITFSLLTIDQLLLSYKKAISVSISYLQSRFNSSLLSITTRNRQESILLFQPNTKQSQLQQHKPQNTTLSPS